MSKSIQFLRSEEALALMRSETDIITLRLLIAAKFYRGVALHTKYKRPKGDWDILFHMQVLQLYFCNHELLNQILGGKEYEIDDSYFSNMYKPAQLLQKQEAIEFIQSEPNLIVKNLLIGAHYYMDKALYELNMEPIGGFDYLFHMQVLEIYFQDYEILEQILSGEELSF